MSQKLSIILRGHIRNAFMDKTLYNYVKKLADEYDLKIYIQTWNIIQTDVSWRHMEKNESPVTDSLINEYFDDLSTIIKKIIILDDNKIKLIGKTTGRMGKTAGSYLGWKRMWYGKREIAAYLKMVEPEPDHFIINTRFDVFNNSVSFSLNSINDKLKNIMNSTVNPDSISKNIFLKDVEFFGMDNFYIGNVNSILKLAEQFNYRLDEIVNKYPRVTSHEFYTYHVNNTLFFDKFNSSNKLMNMQLISPTLHPLNKISELKSFDKNDDKTAEFMLSVIDNTNPVLPPSTHVRSNNMQLFDKNDTFNDPDVYLTTEVPILPPSTHVRSNNMQLFDKNESIRTTMSSINIDNNQTPILPNSSNSRSNKMPLFDKNESIKNTVSSINIDDNQISILSASSNSRNNKMPLMDSTPSLITSTIVNTTQLSTLPSMIQNKNTNKMELFDSNAPSIDIINNENKIALVSSNVTRRGSVPLIDSSNKNNNPITMANIDLPILSSNSQTHRSVKPLISIDQPQLNVSNYSDVVLMNTSLRNNSISMIDVKEKPTPAIDQIPIVKPVPVIEEVPIIEIKKPLQNKYINKPVPISKFSVTLDPSYLNLDNIELPPPILNISDNTKLIHGNKFKTNTQSLAAYYALLSQ
jgi:hypothetical protein